MLIERLTIFVVLATVANLACVVLLAIATYYNVRNYRVLRRIQERSVPAGVPAGAPARTARPAERSVQATARATERYDSLDVPDRGQAEWTGPVVPYIPADRAQSASRNE
jgi:hypothetical protein